MSVNRSIETNRRAKQITYRDTTVRRMSSCTLDSSLIRFCARVTEEDLVGVRVFAQPIGQGGLFGDEVQVRHVMDLRHLVLDGLGEVVVVVPESTCGDTADTIKVILSVGRFEEASLSGIDRQFVPTVRRLNVAVVQIL